VVAGCLPTAGLRLGATAFGVEPAGDAGLARSRRAPPRGSYESPLQSRFQAVAGEASVAGLRPFIVDDDPNDRSEGTHEPFPGHVIETGEVAQVD
jgi:hypothetical protein